MANTLKLQDVLTKDELRELSKPSDIKAVLILAGNLAMVVGAFALAIQWPNPLTILFAVLVLGGRQLGLGVINHDCAHHAFFSSKWMNEFVGHWIAGAPINTSVHAYRAYHLRHHQHAGTQEDPDRWMVKDYPLAPERLRRKLMRDVTGQTGFRDTMRQLKAFSLKKNLPWLSFHVVLLTALTAAGAPWAYLLWWAANLFVFPVIVRIRQISEHGVASDRDSLDPRENTGTTLIGWWRSSLSVPITLTTTWSTITFLPFRRIICGVCMNC